MYAPNLITAIADPDDSRASERIRLPWWSFGKTALAAACLVLSDAGRLDLNQQFPQGFTLRQLLRHNAGLPDYGPMPAYHQAVERGDRPWPLPELLERAEAARLRYEPGHGWGYSNIGYALVRQAIEQVAGQPLGAALQALVFGPLDIPDVVVAVGPADVRDCWGVAPGYDPGWVYHGLLLGPAMSAARLLRQLLSGALLTPAARRAMQDAVQVGGTVPDRPWQRAGYGLGLMIGAAWQGRSFTGHSGGGPGSFCAVYAHQPGRAAAAFTRAQTIGEVETVAMTLASSPI